MRETVLTRGSLQCEDSLPFDVRLQCPRCRTALYDLNCGQCGMQMQVEAGIVHALPPDRAAHFRQFIQDYEYIRAIEGRGSDDRDFYLGIPYRDSSGRNSGQWHIRARSYQCLIDKVLEKPGHRSKVLDLGAGNCWMSYRLALLGYRPVAVDLLTNQNDGLGAAVHYRGVLPEFFPRFQAEMTRLPFQSEQFDAIVFNASFHYSENYEATLREAFRCLKRGGIVVISDTAWYSQRENGKKMLAERRAVFLHKYGTTSDSIPSLEFLTDQCLLALEEQLSIRWTVFSPKYGLKWAMRPLIARLGGRREPSRFRIYAARKDA